MKPDETRSNNGKCGYGKNIRESQSNRRNKDQAGEGGRKSMCQPTGKILSVILILLFALPLSISVVHAQSSQDTLDRYISDLMKNPNDYALREKIIRHVQGMKLAPAVPEEARKHMDRGIAAFEDAKNEKDYTDAVVEFQKTVNIAPWLGAGYRGLAVTQDKSGRYYEALQNMKLFLLTNPSAEEDAEKAKTLRNKIEYRLEKAVKETSPEAVARRERDKTAETLRKLDGAKFSGHMDIGCYGEYQSATIQGDEFVFRSRVNRSTCPDQAHTRLGYEDPPWRGKISIIGPGHFAVEHKFPWQCSEFKVSEDGQKIWLFSGNSKKSPFSNNPFYRER